MHVGEVGESEAEAEDAGEDHSDAETMGEIQALDHRTGNEHADGVGEEIGVVHDAEESSVVILVERSPAGGVDDVWRKSAIPVPNCFDNARRFSHGVEAQVAQVRQHEDPDSLQLENSTTFEKRGTRRTVSARSRRISWSIVVAKKRDVAGARRHFFTNEQVFD